MPSPHGGGQKSTYSQFRCSWLFWIFRNPSEIIFVTCYSISCTSRVGGGRGQGGIPPRWAGGGSNLSALLETMDTCVMRVAGMQCQVRNAFCPCHCCVPCCGANSLCTCQSASVLLNQVLAELHGAVRDGAATVRICDYWAREHTIVISS